MTKIIDVSGQTFGRLTAVEIAGRDLHGRAVWRCICGCGSEIKADSKRLRNGNTRSCGCLAMDGRVARATTHGMTYSPEYTAWCRIKSRCLNQKSLDYADYGGRGISICDEWAISFDAFFKEVGSRPSAAHSIDRINNDRGYEPGNCRWALPRTQANNKRSNRVITAYGKSQTLSLWAREVGLSRGALKQRLARGWPIERALSEATN